MQTKILIGQFLLVLAIVVFGCWFATEWAAYHLGFQARLGAPWFLVRHLPIYYPWRLAEWWYVYEAYAPEVFTQGGEIAAGSGIVASCVAIVCSVWRAGLEQLCW